MQNIDRPEMNTASKMDEKQRDFWFEVIYNYYVFNYSIFNYH